MRKLITTLLLIVGMSVNAQTTFDETDLIGTWTVTNISGTLPLGIKSFSGLVLGETINRYDYDWGTEVYYRSGVIKDLFDSSYRDKEPKDTDILDFFISNGNKLHIIVHDVYSFRFVIEELTSTTMQVRSFGGSNCTIVFSKEASSGIRSTTRSNDVNSGKYDLSGRRIDKPHQGEVFIENGMKRISKHK